MRINKRGAWSLSCLLDAVRQADCRQIQACLLFVTLVNMGLVGCFSDTFLTKYFIFEAKDCVDQVY